MKKLTFIGIMFIVIQFSYHGRTQTWTYHTTDYGHIKLGPCNNSGWFQINGDVTGIEPEDEKFLIYGKALIQRYGLFGAYLNEDIRFNTDVTASSFGTTRMIIKQSNGNVGIGKDPGNYKLDVNGNIKASALTLDYHGDEWTYAFYLKVDNDKHKAFSVIDKNVQEVFRVYGNGVVNAKKIYAEAFEVRTDAMDKWPDYVFDDHYKLKNLNEVEQYIKSNNHLPDIPSENEINENGFNLAEMDGLLLKKIEELTLYVIKQQKEIEHLKAKINSKE
jgi:hypothetical protein